MSPTERSLALLRKQGYEAAVVERWNPHAKLRQDLFGFADIMAVRPGSPPVMLQVTSRTNHAARRSKVLDSLSAHACAAAGMKVVVHSWGKLKAGWTLKEDVLTVADFAAHRARGEAATGQTAKED